MLPKVVVYIKLVVLTVVVVVVVVVRLLLRIDCKSLIFQLIFAAAAPIIIVIVDFSGQTQLAWHPRTHVLARTFRSSNLFVTGKGVLTSIDTLNRTML